MRYIRGNVDAWLTGSGPLRRESYSSLYNALLLESGEYVFVFTNKGDLTHVIHLVGQCSHSEADIGRRRREGMYSQWVKNLVRIHGIKPN
jgi:hypothetical protein